VARLARAYLTSPGRLVVSDIIRRDSPLAESLPPTTSDTAKADEDALVALDVEGEVAHGFLATAAQAEVGEAGPVARQADRPISDAAVALDLVGKAAGLDRLVEGIKGALAVVPAPSRLTAWQGRALLDDLRAWRRAAAAAALAIPGPPGEGVSMWEGAHQPELTRAGLLLSSATSMGADPLALAALVLRRLQLAL
jgi:hypothetical protein